MLITQRGTIVLDLPTERALQDPTESGFESGSGSGPTDQGGVMRMVFEDVCKVEYHHTERRGDPEGSVRYLTITVPLLTRDLNSEVNPVTLANLRR